jgi:hypothetical protein
MHTHTEVIRQKLLQACDEILDAPPIVRRLISADMKRLTRAMRTYYQQAGGDELAKVAELYDAEPVRREDDEPTGE